MKEYRLNNCPFCGCSNLYIIDEDDDMFTKLPAIFCNGCKSIYKVECDSPYLKDDDTYDYMMEKTVAGWNARSK